MNLVKGVNKTHDLYMKYYKLNERFKIQLTKNNLYVTYISIVYKDYKKGKAIVIDDTEENNKLLAFLNRRKKSFFRIQQCLLKVLMSMKTGLELKTFKKLNINPFKKAIATKDIKQTLIEYNSFYRKIKYFLYLSYQTTFIYTNIKKVRGQYYYQNAQGNKKRGCINDKCRSQDREEMNREFTKEFYMNIKTIKAMKAFVKTPLFRDYFECLYNECNKEVIAFYRSHLTHLYVLQTIKDSKNGKKYQNEYNKIRKSLSYKKIKTFEDFLKVVRKYSIFIKRLK
jgi:hypothetical protein